MNQEEHPSARTERLNIRLTKDEMNMLVEKSKECSHGNKTRLIVEAVRSYNSKAMMLKYMNIRKYSDIFNAITTELSRQGNNLNQIAHRLNSMVKEGEVRLNDNDIARFVFEVLQPFLEDFTSKTENFKKHYSRILNEMIKRE